MSRGPFLNITVPKDLMARLGDYRSATWKPARAEAARELGARGRRSRSCPCGGSRSAWAA